MHLPDSGRLLEPRLRCLEPCAGEPCQAAASCPVKHLLRNLVTAVIVEGALEHARMDREEEQKPLDSTTVTLDMRTQIALFHWRLQYIAGVGSRAWVRCSMLLLPQVRTLLEGAPHSARLALVTTKQMLPEIVSPPDTKSLHWSRHIAKPQQRHSMAQHAKEIITTNYSTSAI